MTETTPIPPVVPMPPIGAPKRRSSGGAANLVLALAALVAVGGVAFAGGRATAPASSTGQRGAFAGANGYGPTGSFTPGQGGGFGTRTETLNGTVTAVDGSKLTIKTSSGASVTVDTSSAAYHAQAAATASDVTTGTTVQVSVSGGGFPGGGPVGAPGASSGPAASGGPASTGGSTTLTASDVTITAK